MSEIIVRVADMRVGNADDVLVTIGLGSCVAIVLYDAAAQVGGLAHVLLPSPALTRAKSSSASLRFCAALKRSRCSHRRAVARGPACR